SRPLPEAVWASLPEPQTSINSQKELTPAELAQAVDFYAGGIAMVPQGEKFLKEVPETQAGKQTELKKSESDEVTAEGIAAKAKSPPLAQEPASGPAELSKGINVAGVERERDTKPSAPGQTAAGGSGSATPTLGTAVQDGRLFFESGRLDGAAPQPQEPTSR